MPGQAAASIKRRSPLATTLAWASVGSLLLGLSYYLLTHLSSDAGNASSSPNTRKRRKIAIAASDPEEVLRVLANAADINDDLTVLLYCPSHSKQHEVPSQIMRKLQSQVSHVLRYETSTGVIHISRHISPDLLILLPSSDAQHAAAIKDWVGQVVICAHTGPDQLLARNVTYVEPTESTLLVGALAV
ncbi:hypothetical protein BCR37DRAFT_243291 [Protomyces lactucae-debilis]|uniref:Uncharacterized protein n=1 Tax=Protomyces lactucae-debilis TaxID=2754530 RepID=A0A1Y2FQW1_PROLT|nr:uncharacterized protein BCR37DRAFT_243291 [Protomyces lactucae-debilis]ORY85596.1 hypothetical protein BCR37DRAFT_243291 [Protomyces lactucae-debilis]